MPGLDLTADADWCKRNWIIMVLSFRGKIKKTSHFFNAEKNCFFPLLVRLVFYFALESQSYITTLRSFHSETISMLTPSLSVPIVVVCPCVGSGYRPAPPPWSMCICPVAHVVMYTLNTFMLRSIHKTPKLDNMQTHQIAWAGTFIIWGLLIVIFLIR